MRRIIVAALCLAFAPPAFVAAPNKLQQDLCKGNVEKQKGMTAQEREKAKEKCMTLDVPPPQPNVQQQRNSECWKKSDEKGFDSSPQGVFARRMFIDECLRKYSM